MGTMTALPPAPEANENQPSIEEALESIRSEKMRSEKNHRPSIEEALKAMRDQQ